MKNIKLSLIFIVCTSIKLIAQDTLPVYKHFYIGFEYGFVGNIGNMKAEISSGTIIPGTSYFTGVSPKISFLIGFDTYKKNSFEFAYQQLQNLVSFQYDLPRADPKFPNTLIETSFKDFSYYNLRYFYRLSNLNKRWRWQAQTGIGIIQLLNSGFGVSTAIENGSIQFDSVKVSYNYSSTEERYKKISFSLEAGLGLETNLTQHLLLSFWTRYIFSPLDIRGESFILDTQKVIDTKVTKNPTQTGLAQSNMNSFCFGTGIRFFF